MYAQAVAVVFVGVLIGLVAVGLIVSSGARFHRAMEKVVRLFRERGATSAAGAATVDQIGFGPRALGDRMFALRDFRPYALWLLIDSGAIKMTEDGGLYLSEEDLARAW